MGTDPDRWDDESSAESTGEYEEWSERRIHRSDSRQEALGYQLEHVQQQLALQAMVLCDDFGEVVASAGSRRVIDGLSAQIPWLISTPPALFGRSLGYMWEVCPDIDEEQIALCTLSVQGEHPLLVLCGIGDTADLDEGVAHVARGVDRIIRTMRN
ncbi:MAG: hypothetical protein JW797_04520 [Bradymonadales bacterium]|nr:hypothetical protein [Bradymonadales bacterium]